MRGWQRGGGTVTSPVAAGALAIVALLGWSCGRQREAPLRIVMDNDIGTLDPYHHNAVTTWSVLSNVYDGLVRFSRDMKLEPALATSWRWLDATHVRFELRPDVAFHDGSRFGPGDVVASFERARGDPRSAIGHHLVGIRSVAGDGPHAVVVETEEPSPTLLNRLAFLFIMPAPQAGLAEITRPVGTGPYRFVGRDADGVVHLEAWGGWRPRPAIARVEIAFDADDEHRMREFLAGRSDVVHRVPDASLREVQRVGRDRLEVEPRMAVQIVRIVPTAGHGQARAALADPQVRRALLLAINRDRLVNDLFAGNGTVASQFVHPVVFGYDPALRPEPYDPAGARRLLAAAGFAGGFSTTLGFGAGAGDVASAIRGDLEQVGIHLTLRGLPFPELIAEAQAGALPLVSLSRTCTTGDASDFFDSLVHTADPQRGYGSENWSGYSHPELDDLIERADRELDPTARLALLHQVQRAVLVDLPILPLTVRWGFVGVSRRVTITTRHDGWLWAASFRWRD